MVTRPPNDGFFSDREIDVQTVWHTQQRDEGRSFVLGERLGYVLLPGYRTQDDAAEDPLAAAKLGLTPDLELYWRNKLLRPLTEIFKTCLSPAELSVRPRSPSLALSLTA